MAERINIAALVAVAANRAGVGRVAALGTGRCCNYSFVIVGVRARILCAAARAKAVFVVMAEGSGVICLIAAAAGAHMLCVAARGAGRRDDGFGVFVGV